MLEARERADVEDEVLTLVREVIAIAGAEGVARLLLYVAGSPENIIASVREGRVLLLLRLAERSGGPH